MLDILKWATESLGNVLLFLVVLWMICPWLHQIRIRQSKNYNVAVGKKDIQKPKASETEEAKKKNEQFTVQG